jgi:hypothetical protein
METPSLLSLALCLAGPSCSGGSSGEPPAPPTPTEITFPGIGTSGLLITGIFDPSIELDPVGGRLWMSFSEVLASTLWPIPNSRIESRIAWSNDAGASWTDAGLVIHASEDVLLPLPPPLDAGTWKSEVPSLVRDPGAPPNERWKVLSHRYLEINGTQHFEHGWIGLSSAPDPTGPWTPERKLFAGSLYLVEDDGIIGPPEVQLNELHPDLAAAQVLSEPGMMATEDSLYVSLLAANADSPQSRIVLLELPHATETWEYRGTLLYNAIDGPLFAVDGFSAPELYQTQSKTMLIATPQINDMYGGTFIFEVEDLETGTLKRTAGVPEIAFQHFGKPGSHNGASTFVPAATGSGLIFSEVELVAPIDFRILETHLIP